MKILYTILLSILVLLSGCSKTTKEKQMKLMEEENGPNLIIATDLHYMSKELIDNSNIFLDFIKSGDGKLVQYTNEITDTLISEVIKTHPSAFIISGDLTFNGEQVSHMELSNRLKKVKKAGIPVLVIPGNHDIYNPKAYRFSGEKVFTTKNITPEDFKKLYEDMGYGDAIEEDQTTLSYLYAVTKDLWVLMIDANQATGYAIDSGSISEETLAWIEQCLIKAKSEDVRVISVTHQNLLAHNELFTSAFTIKNGQELTKLLEQYQVKLNLSGHMHIQHIAKSDNENGIYDIVTNSIAVHPNQYGIVHISPDNQITYQSKSVDVNIYAQNQQFKDNNLKNFNLYSKQFFYDSSYKKIYESLADSDITEEERKRMTDFAAWLNMNYFSGVIYKTLQEDLESEEYQLWKEKAKDTFFHNYLDSILSKESKDENKVIIP